MAATSTTRRPPGPERLPYSGDDEADRLIATDPFALLAGFLLDQQVTVQKAFSGPLQIRRRLGTIDPRRLAVMDASRVRAAFAQPPAIHRFPQAMADRLQALAAVVVDRFGADAASVWRDATDAADLQRRLGALPGIGPMKARTITSLLAHQYGVRPQGYERHLPPQPNLGEVTTPEELAAYQATKRAHKAALRAAAAAPARPARGARR